MGAATPGNPFEQLPPADPAGLGSYVASATGSSELPDTVPIIGAIGDWQVFGVRAGGMGEVYLCVSKDSGVPVALKSFPRQAMFRPATRRAFEREAAIGLLASYYAVGVLPVAGTYRDSTRPFIVMLAVLPGPRGEVSVRDVLSLGPVPLEDVVPMARIVAGAMADAGRQLPGLVHGDLKPENILLWQGVPHVADFGLARCLARQSGDAALGTPGYRAPEGDDPLAPLTAAADVYSFGAILTELLTGRLPARGEAVAGRDAGQARRDLLDLATRCRAIDAAARPGFDTIGQYLDSVVPAEKWPEPAAAAALRSAKPLLMTLLRPQVARSLLDLQQFDLVIEYVAATDADRRDWELWTCLGTALSLTGRDQEALDAYDCAEATLGDGDSEQRWRVGLEAAASLKRLGRYSAAQDRLDGLVQVAPDTRAFESAACNLAALWSDAGETGQAEALLAQILAASPDNAIAWINRAETWRRAGQPGRAATMIHRAITADPGRAEWHARLGVLLMDELGLLGEAGTAFGNAMDCGSLDPDLMVRALACATGSGDEHGRARLLAAISSAYGADVLPQAEHEAMTRIFWLSRKFGGPDSPAAADLPDLVSELVRLGLDDPLAPVPPDGPAGDGRGTSQSDDRDDDDPAGDANAAPAAGPVGQPAAGEERPFRHTQFRFAASGFLYVDVYAPFSMPWFARHVLGQHRLARVTAPRLGGFQLADTRVCLLRCSSCAVELATNRLPGTSLRCQRCREPTEVRPLLGGATEVQAEVDGALGLTIEPLGGRELLLIVQAGPSPADVTGRLTALLGSHGVELTDSPHSGVMLAVADAARRDVIKPSAPYLAGIWRYPAAARGSADMTPEQILILLDEARRLVAPAALASVTHTYDPRSGDPIGRLWAGDPDECERLLSSRPPRKKDAAAWSALAVLASATGDPAAAMRHAESAVRADPDDAAAWVTAGWLRLASGNVAGAVAAGEFARRLDLTDGQACSLLAAGYAEQDDGARARAMALRARAFGAPAEP
jgi:tetratricopeptide (TPR) repeat protein